MNERIKQVREEAGLSQRAFGARIGIGGSSVAMLESGKNNPSEQTIRAICSEFEVTRLWLETGKGEKKYPRDEDKELIDTALMNNDEVTRAFIRGVTRTPGGWELLRKVVISIHEELEKEHATK